jgi:hypothetical protein
MSNQNNRSGASDGSSNQPAKDARHHKGGGNMGAGKSGEKSFGAEKPEERDNAGSGKPGQLEEGNG